jgi:hypothetical protein
MKKFISGLVVGIIISVSIVAIAEFNIGANPFPITFNGNPVEIEAYNINGRTFFQLRDIGAVVGFDVDFVDDTIVMSTDTTDIFLPLSSNHRDGSAQEQDSVISQENLTSIRRTIGGQELIGVLYNGRGYFSFSELWSIYITNEQASFDGVFDGVEPIMLIFGFSRNYGTFDMDIVFSFNENMSQLMIHQDRTLFDYEYFINVIVPRLNEV